MTKNKIKQKRDRKKKKTTEDKTTTEQNDLKTKQQRSK